MLPAVRIAALAFVLALAGCLQETVTNCGGGRFCPLEKVCIANGCALPEQLTACEGLADGEACSFAGSVGRCTDGVCLGSLCGNGITDTREVCDDGNTVSGDGCRADCAKLEMCGDGMLDEGEGCDDGNGNPADGCDGCAPTAWRAMVLIGGNANATAVALYEPTSVAVDRYGNIYIADTNNDRVQRIDVTGVITTIAGNGVAGFSGDNSAATSAQLDGPGGVAVDGLGNVYIADTYNARIRKVDPFGIITTVVGSGLTGGALGDGGPATAASLFGPQGVAVDGLGNLYITDRYHERVRKVDVDGIITTIAGTGVKGFGGDGGAATSAQLNAPTGIAVDALGRIYIADFYNQRIRRVDTNGTITTFAGASGSCTTSGCAAGFAGDGGQASAALLGYPEGVAVDALGRVYIADTNNARIRRVGTDGVITTIAGTTSGFGGDGGPATSAQLDAPRGVGIDAAGNVFVVDTFNHRVRRVTSTGTITTYVGSGAPGYSGDGGSPTCARLFDPERVTVDPAGNVYIADTAYHRIRKIDSTGVISTIAGTGVNGYRASDEGQAATTALLYYPYGLALDSAGNLYVADSQNHRVRRIDTAGRITTVAGTGTAGYDGDGALATTKRLNQPYGVAVDSSGNLYIADFGNHRVRKVDTAGTISTIAGTGTGGFSGDNGAATSAMLFGPHAVAVSGGELYIADTYNVRIRKVGATGTITTVAGNGSDGFSGDGGAATSATLSTPADIAIDSMGRLLIADSGNYRARRVANGIITTIAGGGPNTDFDGEGDGGPATSATTPIVSGIAADAQGRVYMATYTDWIRRMDTNGTITTLAGFVDPPGMGPLAQARLADPVAFVPTPSFTLVAGGNSGTVQRATASWLEVVAGRYAHGTSVGALARFRNATFGNVAGLAYDAANNAIFISESSAHRLHVITIVDPSDENTWTIAPLANAAGTAGFANGAAAAARFREPTGLYLDTATRQLYVADTGNHAVRAIDLSNGIANATVRTIAGVPATRGFFGDGDVATAALLFEPRAITRCANGDLFVADTGNHRVRRIATTTNVISTVVGDGQAGSSGEGSPASTFPVHAPRSLACDDLGNLYVASTTTLRLVPADANGIVDGTGSVQTIYGAAPRDRFPESVTNCLSGLAITAPDALQFSDSCTGLLIELRREKQ